MEIPNMDIQQYLDKWLAENPEAQKYVSKLWYQPEGQNPNPATTHTFRIASVRSDQRALTVGLVVKPEFAAALDALLAMIATAPQ